MTKSRTQKKTQSPKTEPKADPKVESPNGDLMMTESAQWSDPIIIGQVGSLTISAREPLNQLAINESNPSMMTALALHNRLNVIFSGVQQVADGYNALLARIVALEPVATESSKKEDSEGGGGDSSIDAAE